MRSQKKEIFGLIVFFIFKMLKLAPKNPTFGKSESKFPLLKKLFPCKKEWEKFFDHFASNFYPFNDLGKRSESFFYRSKTLF